MINLLNDKTKWRYNPAWAFDDDDSQTIWQDSSISMKAKGLFGYMRNKPSNWDFSCKRISGEMRDSIDAVQTAMKELEGFGYLDRVKLGSGRLMHTISSSPYVGIEPEIEKSSLDRYDTIMHVEDSLYS